ncbi:hypothetical protein HOF56_04920 [Candidatus Peribacteria bacterium]|jgi:hypothetical protein|nr:hypothetical protein [Candidatus Peribacteria bacterium]MBT4021468.1 hypothetical protein [Candidatus Peribacteria bacterium]MBT4240378.1 hypothetical protein [Candidatus Peribacteria bacterium]MBT4473801.1 hypothetical protein [Candidatus Peribacteria bacterium]
MAKDKNSKAKSSVRNRKKASEATAVQRFLPIAEIKQNTVLLKNGGMRAVVAVGSMNFSLKSEDEQQAIVTSYQQFLNTLSFPVQMLVRSTQLNVDAYIKDLEERAGKQENPLLKEQTLDYAKFIEKLVDVSEIMQKRFYCIVPMDAAGAKSLSFFQKYMSWLTPGDTKEKALSRKRQFEESTTKLKDRVNMVETGLENIGVTTERLNTAELIELFYSAYNPQTSQEQKIGDPDALNTKDYVL